MSGLPYNSIGQYLNGSFAGGNTVTGLNEDMMGLICNPKFAVYNETVSAWEGRACEGEARYPAVRRETLVIAAC
ncbi:MAG: hypothetical protein Q8N94_06115 [Methanoregula sp.]|nr:hypothetical protein [Methanoregula sp.]